MIGIGKHPVTRPRRNRQNEWNRQMVAETRLSPADLVWPLFVIDAEDGTECVPSLSGVARLARKPLQAAAQQAVDLGIPAIALFPVVAPELKNENATEACNRNNLMCRSVQWVKDAVGDQLGVICDIALDPYTPHGHDGLLRDGVVVNDETVDVLVRQSLVQAEAGCDIIAPSDMMDGRIGAIRNALDADGFEHVRILSYAAKYASSFYGPFREAVGSHQALGQADKCTYQMDPANVDEAVREVALDLDQGADMVMVKPGLPYLDVLQRVKQTFGVPTFAYQVSGEYAMIQLAGAQGCLNAQHAMIEALQCFKRAGADGIFSYAAAQVAEGLRK